MRMSKRDRERLLKYEAEADRQLKLHPPKRRPFSPEDSEKFEKLESIVRKITLSRGPDSSLIEELDNCAGFLTEYGCLRVIELQRRFRHYRSLKNHAAKRNELEAMSSLANGIYAEANTVRTAMERDGTKVQ